MKAVQELKFLATVWIVPTVHRVSTHCIDKI